MKDQIGRHWLGGLRLALAFTLASLLTGCASFYVDSATPEVAASEYKKPVPLQPVQVLFQFQSKGVSNDVATKQLKGRVIEQVRSSGLFASVSEQPVAGAALLALTLNNVPLDDSAFAKGFVTGLTFGLAGSKVSDGYVLTLNYRSDQVSPQSKQARHAIHTTIGAAAAPGNAVKAASVEEAVYLMTRQVMSQGLKALSDDPAFR